MTSRCQAHEGVGRCTSWLVGPGLGIPVPIPGCPCRQPGGRLNILGLGAGGLGISPPLSWVPCWGLCSAASGHGYGGSGFRLAPQAYGGGAGCWVFAGTWPPPGGSRTRVLLRVCSPSPMALCEGLLRLWLCAGVLLRRWHCAWVPLRLWLCVGVLLRRWPLCAGSSSPMALCGAFSFPFGSARGFFLAGGTSCEFHFAFVLARVYSLRLWLCT